ncbi:nucleoside hydrolase [Cyclobacterium plantarum]|uniref:nucleoside hydrolase n=1 Tax=Cyclobacterium plantarum TaxID=2716263 RepID=UPI003F71E992
MKIYLQFFFHFFQNSGQFLLLLPVILLPLSPSFSQDYPTLPEAFRLNQLQAPEGKVEVVIDTDTYNEIDDQFAVVYALLSPEAINVSAIYAAPYLNNRSVSPKDGMEKSFEEIERLLDKLGMERNDFVYRGSEAFLESPEKPLESPAAKDLVERAMQADGPLYVLTLGAPTNVSSAILMEPEIIHKIVVVWLGGKGLNWKTATEFNLMQDPIASQVLFDSGVPLIQIPTQPVTSHLHTTVAEVETYLSGQGAIGDYLVEIFNEYQPTDGFGWSKVIWDISAIAYVIDPGWFSTEIRSSPILTDRLTYSFDHTRHLYRVATYLNRDRIFGDMFKKIQQYKDQ